MLFQLMFDELLTPPPSVDLLAPEVVAPIHEVEAPVPAISTGSPSSTNVDQDAPSPSNSQTTPETQPPAIPNDVEEYNHDIEVTHMGNDPYFGIPIPEVLSDQSSSSDIIHTIVHPDHPLENIIVNSIDQFPQGCSYMKQALFLNTVLILVTQWILPWWRNPNWMRIKKGKPIDSITAIIMDWTLLYLTASRPDLQFSICMCARYQAWPTEKHLHAVKRIFRYLRGTVNRGLWYPKDSSIAPTAFADADHACCQDTRRSTSG
ncbi:hypothetical protein Tco_0729176 [Tanacetum coccineum]|uniref:Uncharacterized protein n=1 Tax=Tanacetum coccineum TaxID=301880 RepID=A0ABQ4YP32_9ASTR